MARKIPVEDRKEFLKGFNDEAKSRGIKRHGDTGSSDLTHGGLKHAEFKRDTGVSEDKDPCWDGYKQLGMKKKDGKKVPNCIPKENLDQNQKRAKQLGPTEKVGPKGAVGKLVGEDRVTKQVSEAIDDILRGTGF